MSFNIDAREHLGTSKPNEESSDPTRGLCWSKAHRNALYRKYCDENGVPRPVTFTNREGEKYTKVFNEYAHNAPLVKCMLTFTSEELLAYLKTAEANGGGIKLVMEYWDSKHPETSDGFTKEPPHEDNYNPAAKSKPQPQSTVETPIVPDVLV